MTWQVKKLGEVCTIVNGGTPKSGVSNYWDGIHQWITPSEMGRRITPYVANTERTITDAGMQNSSARLLPKFSVILSSRAPIGHLVINTEPMATNQGCKGLVPNHQLNHKFLFYYLSNSVQLLNDLGTGATFKEISGGKLKEVSIPFPPLPEQERIVSVLDEAFDGIATAKTNTEKNFKKARELFDAFLDAKFRSRSEGWIDTPLNEICERVSVGHVGPTSNFYCEQSIGIPFLRSQNVRRGHLDLDGVQYVTQDFHKKLRKSQLRPRDLLFVRVGANRGDCCSVPDGIGEINCANIVFARPALAVNVLFLERFCDSIHGRRQLLGMTTGSAQGVINTSSVAELIIPLPSLQEQDLIVNEIDEFFTESIRLETIYRQKIAALDELKKALLHKAFAGEL